MLACNKCYSVAQANPAVLWNHDNDYLHYSDDWYILASKPDEYLLIYYKGNNDAWKGYGGATVYTRYASASCFSLLCICARCWACFQHSICSRRGTQN